MLPMSLNHVGTAAHGCPVEYSSTARFKPGQPRVAVPTRAWHGTRARRKGGRQMRPPIAYSLKKSPLRRSRNSPLHQRGATTFLSHASEEYPAIDGPD